MSELVLINVSGRDKPGLTSEITGIMGRYDVRILDIGQAVIHDHLTWGILIEIPDESKSSPVIRDLLFRLHALDLQVRFAPITVEEYQSWAAARNRACNRRFKTPVPAGCACSISASSAIPNPIRPVLSQGNLTKSRKENVYGDPAVPTLRPAAAGCGGRTIRKAAPPWPGK